MMATLDHRLSLALSGWARAHRGVGRVAIVLASWLIWPVGLVAVGVAVTSFERCIYLLGVALIGWVLNLLLGCVKERKRPFDTHAYRALISTRWLGGSFPSDHAMTATVCASLLFTLGGVWAWAAVASVCLVGLGRILVGVHYVSDVLVGVAVGVTAALCMLQVTPLLG